MIVRQLCLEKNTVYVHVSYSSRWGRWFQATVFSSYLPIFPSLKII